MPPGTGATTAQGAGSMGLIAAAVMAPATIRPRGLMRAEGRFQVPTEEQRRAKRITPPLEPMARRAKLPTQTAATEVRSIQRAVKRLIRSTRPPLAGQWERRRLRPGAEGLPRPERTVAPPWGKQPTEIGMRRPMATPIETRAVGGRRTQAVDGTMSTEDRVPLGAWKGIPGDGETQAAGPQELRAIEVGTACARADLAGDDSAAVAFVAAEGFVASVESSKA